MAKELPYFRFTPQEWQNGDISLEDYELKGIFIDICAYYWVNDCSLTLAKLKKRFKDAQSLIDKLIDLFIIDWNDNTDFIQIYFLNEQFDILSEQRKRRQKAGSKGGKQKSSNAKAMLKQNSSYKDKDKDNNKDKDKYNEILDFFHNTCKSLPKVIKLTDQRKKTIDLRIKEFDLKTLGTVFKLTNESDFLSGRSGKFKTSFDWIIKKSNFIKILEGNYKNINNEQRNSKINELAKITAENFGEKN